MRLILKGLPLLITAGVAAIPAAPAFAQDSSSIGSVVVEDDPVITPAPPPPAPPPPPPRMISYEDRALDAVTRPELTPFANEREFRRYLRRSEEVNNRRRRHWISLGDDRPPPMMAFQDSATEEIEVCSDPELCEEPEQNIVVTAQAAARPTSITNNQTAGVDEGDIVKQIGDYLLVLQDGRIFALNLRTMQRTDWIDAYRRDEDADPIGADWYDEMLVQDDHILITAYSYQDSATELSVFKLDQASGRLSRLGVFLISSDDYYSSDNYATRIVGDRLVMYAPYDLDALENRKRRPLIRRWQGPEERDEAQRRGRPLIDAQRLYWPVMRTNNPSVHTISICPLSEIERRDLACETTGFVAPPRRQMFVSPEAVYLWTSSLGEGDAWSQDSCSDEKTQAPRASARDVAPAVVYRVPVRSGEPSLLPVRGMVFDQFGMDEFDGRFRGLAAWISERCSLDEKDSNHVALVDVPLSAFSTTYTEATDRDFEALPVPGSRALENRFIDNWLVYGGRLGWGSGGPSEEDKPQSARAIAVPLRHPEQAQVFEPGHGHIRIERVGNDAMLNGYHDHQGLHVTMLKLEETARIAGHIRLDGRFESEGRSHAFNSLVNPDGSGILGLPTVRREEDSDRWWWRSRRSELSFMALDRTGALTDLGFLSEPDFTGPDAERLKLGRRGSGYECEVSCVDWYGNTRPIFTLGRIFGLMETDVVEATIENGAIREATRVSLTSPWPGPGRTLRGEDDDDE